MPEIHATAIVDPSAELADDVIVGPGCVIESDVKIGPGCVLRPGAVIRRYTEMGAGNYIDSFVVLGGDPQDFKFQPSRRTHLRIGDRNVFREHVTISRATTEGGATVVGSDTYWMAGSHLGHDGRVDDRVVLVNGCKLAGHTHVAERAILSANCLVHQFCWVGRMVMSRGGAAVSMHAPPYVMLAEHNHTVGLNVVGLRRAPDITDEDRRQIKEAYAMLYRRRLGLDAAVAAMDACTDWGAPAKEFREFCRRVQQAEAPHDRGLVGPRRN